MNQPDGARNTRCGNCGYTYGTHAAWCYNKMKPTNFPIVADDNACAHYHTVNKELIATKSALHDALACKIPVKCVTCGFEASQLPEAKDAVFGLPPAWFARVFKNLAGECLMIESEKPKR